MANLVRDAGAKNTRREAVFEVKRRADEEVSRKGRANEEGEMAVKAMMTGGSRLVAGERDI